MAGNQLVQVALEVLEQSSAPSAPAAGSLALYPKTDGALYAQDSGGVERKVGPSPASAYLDRLLWR